MVKILRWVKWEQSGFIALKIVRGSIYVHISELTEHKNKWEITCKGMMQKYCLDNHAFCKYECIGEWGLFATVTSTLKTS